MNAKSQFTGRASKLHPSLQDLTRIHLHLLGSRGFQ
jgi:hypothetical protein